MDMDECKMLGHALLVGVAFLLHPPFKIAPTEDNGPTIFMPFQDDTDNFEADRQWMINFRVRDLDALIGHLKSLNIEVITKAEWDSVIGRFARFHDPDSNLIELWEPAEGAF